MARPSKRKLARLRNLEKAHQRLGRVPREKLQNVSVVDVTYHDPVLFCNDNEDVYTEVNSIEAVQLTT